MKTSQKTQIESAYEEGFDSYFAGNAVNPYQRCTAQYADWQRGYAEAREMNEA